MNTESSREKIAGNFLQANYGEALPNFWAG
jgi:hypothetical protein